jgi:hypothetical protein
MKTLKVEQNETSDAQENASLESIHNPPFAEGSVEACLILVPSTRHVKHDSLDQVNGIGHKSLADTDDDDTVIHERTGERFNKRTGEFVW